MDGCGKGGCEEEEGKHEMEKGEQTKAEAEEETELSTNEIAAELQEEPGLDVVSMDSPDLLSLHPLEQMAAAAAPSNRQLRRRQRLVRLSQRRRSTAATPAAAAAAPTPARASSR